MNVGQLVSRLGRLSIAEACGVTRGLVASWIYNNRIPVKHMSAVRELARNNGVDLAAFERRASDDS